MREGPATIIRRQDYLAPAFWLRSAELTFDLDPAKTIVASRLTFVRNVPAPEGQPLKLHGEGLTLLRVLADGESVSFRHEGDLLVIDNPPDRASFVLEIRNTCAPEKNTALSGLYTSGGGFFTQCEAEGFRRITYFLDRPDVMAVFTVTLRADKARYPVLLSNGNLVETRDLPNGRHQAKWHDPFPKPAYLFALVAANLVCREQRILARSGKEHLLQIYVRRGDLGKTEHAMQSLLAAVAWDEARFGLSLDLDRFMIVAVGDYNMGAMENKGLNIFNTALLLASPGTATDEDFADIESVVAHEYFHNWTGNRITCRDWFQLSLKEGLTVYRDQEFSMDMAGPAPATGSSGSPGSAASGRTSASAWARAVKRISDVRMLRAIQFPEDAGPMAHPVRPDEYAEINNFYTATVYEKGAEVVRMMATLVGRDGFRAGMDLYFKRHDGQAVTCDDFAQAIADANASSPLAEHLTAFKRWYAQAGTPTLRARGSYDAATRRYHLSLAQTPAATPGQNNKQPFVLPVALGFLSHEGRVLDLQLEGEPEPGGGERLLVLTEAEQSFTFVGVDSAPVPSLLRGLSAPALLDDGLDDAGLLVLLQHDPDPLNRWEAGQRLGLNRLLAAMPGDATMALDGAYIEAMRGILRHPDLAPAFKDLVLTLPSEPYVAENCAVVDPQRIHALREQMRLQLAQALQADWAWAFEAHQVRDGYRPEAAQSGQRALANRALGMLVLQAAHSGDAAWPGRAYQRSKDASCMTERYGALEALVGAGAELAEPALQHFYERFRDDALVIDKWFTVQALASEPSGAGAGRVLHRVKALMQHPDFSLTNPNRARSLIMAYCRGNPAAFHRSDAAGYVFWADRVAELDAINPQVAARLARSMDRWSHLAEPWRSAAREALVRVAAKTDLSNDVREIVGKALEPQPT